MKKVISGDNGGIPMRSYGRGWNGENGASGGENGGIPKRSYGRGWNRENSSATARDNGGIPEDGSRAGASLRRSLRKSSWENWRWWRRKQDVDIMVIETRAKIKKWL